MSKKLVFIFVSGIVLFIGFNVYVFIVYQNFKKSMRDTDIVLINKRSNNVVSSDNLSEAEKQLQHIRDRPEEWGNISQKASRLIEMLLPVPEFDNEDHSENAILLLDELAELRDPRSAEVFVKYFLYSHWGRKQEEALIDIGVPAIPHLVDYLNSNDSGREIVVSRLLGIITSQHKKELGDIVDEIIVPGLGRMARSNADIYIEDKVREALALIQK